MSSDPRPTSGAKARRQLEREAEIEAWREAQVDQAPPVTEDQIRKLAAVLNGAG